jgi:hypothetical protein
MNRLVTTQEFDPVVMVHSYIKLNVCTVNVQRRAVGTVTVGQPHKLSAAYEDHAYPDYTIARRA